MPPAPKKLLPKITPKLTPTSSVLDRIKPISFDHNEGIKILLYGKSATGKTTLWATFPGPILSIICSGGNKSGELRSVNTPEYRQKIKPVELYNSGELLTLADWLKNDGGDQFSTVVLDHASGLQDMVLREILGLEEIPVQKYWGLATQQQYGQCALRFKELIRPLLSFSGNVVIVAQERENNVENADASELLMPSVGAGLSPSIAGWLNTAVDYICNTFLRQQTTLKKTSIGKGSTAKTIETKVMTDRVEYCLRTGANAVYTTKFRLPKGVPLPDVIVDPDYSKIMALINGMS